MQNIETPIKDIQAAILGGRYKEELADIKQRYDPDMVKLAYNDLPEKEKERIVASASTTQQEFQEVTKRLLESNTKEDLASLRSDYHKAAGDTCYRFLPIEEQQRIKAISVCNTEDIRYAKERLLRCKNKVEIAKEREWMEGLYGLAIADMSKEEQQQLNAAEATALTPPPPSHKEKKAEEVTDTGYDFNEVIAASNIAMKSLGWGAAQGKEYLLEHYGKRSRQLLSDEELIGFTVEVTKLAGLTLPKFLEPADVQKSQPETPDD